MKVILKGSGILVRYQSNNFILIKFILLLFVPASTLSQTMVKPSEILKLVHECCTICSSTPLGTYCQSKIIWENTFYTSYHNCHIYYFNKQFDSAYWYAIKTIACITTKKYDAAVLCNLATYIKARILYDKHMYRQSLHDFQTLAAFKSFNQNVIGDIWANIGTIYLDQEKYDSSIRYLLKAINSLSPTDIYTLQNSYGNIASCYLLDGNLKQALRYFQKGNVISRKLRDTTALASSYINIANLYYNQYRDNLALSYFKRGLALALRTSNNKLKQEACFNLAVFYENKNDFISSVRYRKEYEKWHDSVYNQDNIWNIAQQGTRLAEQEKEHQAKLMRQAGKLHMLDISKKVLQRNTFFTLAIVFLLFMLFVFYAYYQKVHQNKLISAQKEQLDQLNHTKNQLFSIVAHDLRSPVQTLKVVLLNLQTALADKDIKKAERISKQIEKISKSAYSLLNNLLYWALDQADKLSFTKDKLNIKQIIEQISYDYSSFAAAKQIVLQNLVPSTAYCIGDINTIKIIFRNLIDNAIKYSSIADNIMISAKEINQICVITVRDFGPGIQEFIIESLQNKTYTGISGTTNSQSTGLGLWLVKSLVEKNCGQLQIEKRRDGTVINVLLPMIDYT